jgi:hypothetical protein
MPQAVQRLNIFVSSSGDVAAERDALKGVVSGMDERCGRLGVDLHLIDWRSGVIPDMGSDAQDVINRQVRFDGIDIFLGIVWSRIGTQTPRAMSGTVEEVNRAIASRNQCGWPRRMMFFLCDREIPQGLADATQAQEARKFKQWIESCAICKHYDDLAGFKEQASLALTLALDEFLMHPPNAPQPQPPQPPQPQVQPRPISWVWADMYQQSVHIYCPWCSATGPVGTMTQMQYQSYRGGPRPCPRCGGPHYFP